jgi:hypothetical protein
VDARPPPPPVIRGAFAHRAALLLIQDAAHFLHSLFACATRPAASHPHPGTIRPSPANRAASTKRTQYH